VSRATTGAIMVNSILTNKVLASLAWPLQHLRLFWHF
jgi:hypothetical protein